MSESDAYCLMRQHEEIDKLQARVAELEEALFEYGSHRPECPTYSGSCECGFSAVIAKGRTG